MSHDSHPGAAASRNEPDVPHAEVAIRPHPGFAPSPAWWRAHALIPVVVLLAASLLLMGLGGDFAVADALYALQGHEWAYRKTFLAQAIIHTGGRNASLLAWLVVVVVAVMAARGNRFAARRRPLAYLAIAVLAGVTATSALKAVTGMDCPWDLARYGGLRDYIGLFTLRPESLPSSRCFPAGHASAGFAWVALYFYFSATRPAWRVLGLAAGLAIGALFGFSQQLRGAHFFSHDLWTLAVCWSVSLGLYLAMFWRRPAGVALAQGGDHG